MSIKGKLIGLVLLMSLVLGLLAGYLLWASYRIRHQVSVFIPTIGYLRGIADTRINLTRQMKEATDYLVSANPSDRRNFSRFGAETHAAFELWSGSLQHRRTLGAAGADVALERAGRIRQHYDEWERLTVELFELVAADRRQTALQDFAGSSDRLIEETILPDLDRSFEAAISDVQEAYYEVLLSLGMIPWLAREGSIQLQTTQASLEYLTALTRMSAGINKQVKELLDYLVFGGEHHLLFFADFGKDARNAIADCARAAHRRSSLDPGKKPELLNEVATIEHNYGQVLALAEKAIHLKREGATEAAIRLVIEGLDPLLDAGLNPRISLALDDGGQEISNLSATASRQGVIVVILVSLLIVAGSFRLLQEMLGSLKKLKTGIEKIGRGDLDYRINLGTPDEFGALAVSFDTMVENLQRSREDIDRLNLELEQRVIERTNQLQLSNRELESFSYSVSHDLRGPLSRISGMCQLALVVDEKPLPEDLAEVLSRIDQATREMDQMIAALLNLSRVSSGPLSRSLVDLSAMAGTLAEELRERDPARQVEFRIAPGLRTNGDPGLLLVALSNLLGNAWKYTAKASRPVIEFGLLHRGGQRTVFVRDNGAGFPMDQAGRLFAPFQRLHETDEFDGTGVGLATVQRIIHRHGGEIWAEGAVGQGATFYFTLGLRATEPDPTGAHANATRK
jgi:signal transduction histidine kinase